MQIGNLGGHGDLHQITECMHGHEHMKIKADMNGAAGAAAQSAAQSVSNTETISMSNINTWLTNLLNKSRNMFGRIWGDSGISSDNAAGTIAAERNASAAQQGASDSARSTYAAQSAVSVHQNIDMTAAGKAGTPWFIPVEHQGTVRTAHPGGIRERVKMRFSSVSGFVAKHLPTGSGTFSGMKKHKKEENLTRKSHYKDEKSEIECILTDDSYLLDSYDKNGEYKQIGR